MSVNDSPATAPVPRVSPPETQATSNQRVAGSTLMQRVRAGFGTIEAAIGLPGLAVVASGLALAVGCTAWAIYEGVPQPLAIMIGYCAVIGSLCLGAALFAVQDRAAKASPVDAKRQPNYAARREPNYAAWKLVSSLSVSDASRLWCDIEPGCPASQESIAWGKAMLDAVKRGDLPVMAKDGTSAAASVQEQKNPNWSTEIGRDGLIAWAQAHGHLPRFLQK
jgi:hypothetical protein